MEGYFGVAEANITMVRFKRHLFLFVIFVLLGVVLLVALYYFWKFWKQRRVLTSLESKTMFDMEVEKLKLLSKMKESKASDQVKHFLHYVEMHHSVGDYDGLDSLVERLALCTEEKKELLNSLYT